MRSLLACLLLLPLAVVAQTSTRLGKSLDRLLGDTLFEAGDVSIVVYDLTDGRQLYAHREHKTVRPASVQKVSLARWVRGSSTFRNMVSTTVSMGKKNRFLKIRVVVMMPRTESMALSGLPMKM